MWDVERKAEVFTQSGHSAEIYTMSVHPDGSLLVFFQLVLRRLEWTRDGLGLEDWKGRVATRRTHSENSGLRFSCQWLPRGHWKRRQHHQTVRHEEEKLLLRDSSSHEADFGLAVSAESLQIPHQLLL